MQIHVVKEGETLYSISRQYDTSVGLLARFNGLQQPDALAVGQALGVFSVLETTVVRPGDTLYSIADAAGLSPVELLRLNPNLARQEVLYPGQILVTAMERSRSRAVEVTGYAYPFAARQILDGILPYATALVPFTYGITEEGGLVPLEDDAMLAAAADFSVQPVMHLSTLTENGTFSADRAAIILKSGEKRQRLIAAVLENLEAKGYIGLDVDFEFLGAELAAPYAAFLGQLHETLSPLGYPLYAALAPKTRTDQPGVLYEGHNYAAIASMCDAVLVMTYEWGYTYGPPMAVAPIASVRRVLEYALTQTVPGKILMGFPNYAYDWTLPYVAGASRARLIGNEEAPLLARRYGAEIQYSEADQTPYFHYTDEAGLIHEVWFEDVRSALAKFRLMEQLGLRGLGYWNFMRPFTVGFCLQNVLFSLA